MPASPPAELAPVLRLAHAQLVLAARREATVPDVVAAGLGCEAREALYAARARHPARIPGQPDELARLRDPHDAIERAIGALLAREAAAHASLLAFDGDDAEVRLRLASFDHGTECGREIAHERRCHGPGSVFDALAEHLLEGMPCRPRAILQEESASRVAWSHAECPYQGPWERGRVDARAACQIMSAWVRGLVTGLDASVEYRRPKSIALGDARCEHELVVLR